MGRRSTKQETVTLPVQTKMYKLIGSLPDYKGGWCFQVIPIEPITKENIGRELTDNEKKSITKIGNPKLKPGEQMLLIIKSIFVQDEIIEYIRT